MIKYAKETRSSCLFGNGAERTDFFRYGHSGDTKKAAKSQSVEASRTIKAVPGTPEGVLLMHRGDQDADFRSGVFWPAP
jgi:hypothetical protein